MQRDYDEKRNFIRMCMECSMVYIRTDGSRHEAIARDLSGSGLGFITDQALALGELLTVQVTLSHEVVAPLRAEVEVVRVQPAAAGGYAIGVSIRHFN
jgi:hypothetical protein